MRVLIAERVNSANQYIEQLTNAYQRNNCEVILDVQNFLFSNHLPDLLHLQWPEAIYKWRHQLTHDSGTIEFMESRLKFYADAGVPIVYTIHNLAPHNDAQVFDKDVYKLFAAYSDIVVHHGSASIEVVLEFLNFKEGAKHIVAPHGPYNYNQISSNDGVRKAYGLSNEQVVFLNFGRVRSNKGPGFTDEVFRSWKNSKVCLFTIGPKPMSRLERIRRKVADRWIPPNKNARYIYREVKSSEIPKIMAATDIVFLGHTHGLNSGIVALAASFSKPVVYPDLGNFREQMDGWQWARYYEAGNSKSAVHSLEEILHEFSCAGEKDFDNKQWLEKHSWDKHIQVILTEIYRYKRNS